jgi:hypothetical protein
VLLDPGTLHVSARDAREKPEVRELRRVRDHRSREARRREFLLRTILLRAGDLGMTEPAARGAWRELEAKRRPFVARRVRSEVDADHVMLLAGFRSWSTALLEPRFPVSLARLGIAISAARASTSLPRVSSSAVPTPCELAHSVTFLIAPR